MTVPDVKPLSHPWEKLKVLSTVAATVLIPLVIAIVSQSYTAAIKSNEIGVKYVELALSILRAPPDPQTENLRAWAVSVIDHHSEVPISGPAQGELQKQDLSNVLKFYRELTMTPIQNMR